MASYRKGWACGYGACFRQNCMSQPNLRPSGALRYIPQLDALRAFAVGAVLVTHFWTYPAGQTALNRLAAVGWAGVDLFFVLSGFLITRILLSARHRPHYFRNFYARRTLRIFPLYYAVLLLVFGILPLLRPLPSLLSSDSWMYFAYLSNVSLAAHGWQLFLVDVTWSLAIEEQFYLLWPAIVRWLDRRRLTLLCLGIVIGAPIVREALWGSVGWRWLHMMMPLRADALAMGALLALFQPSRRLAAVIFPTSAAVILGLVLTGHFARDSHLVGTIGYSLTAICSAGLLVLALDARILLSRAAIHIGRVSYGIYLLHPLVSLAVSAMTGTLWKTGVVGGPIAAGLFHVLAVGCLTIAVATLSFRFFETPFLRLKQRFVARRPAGEAERAADAPQSAPLSSQ